MIKLHSAGDYLQNWGVTVDPQQNGKKILVGVGTVSWGSNPHPNPYGNSHPDYES